MREINNREIRGIIELKRQLELANIDYSHLVFMPNIPIYGIREYSIEEIAGIKVACLVSA